MNRRQFLRGAATAAAVTAVPIAAVGQQERFLVKNLGLPYTAQSYRDKLQEVWGDEWRNIHNTSDPQRAGEVARRWKRRLNASMRQMQKTQDETLQITRLIMAGRL